MISSLFTDTSRQVITGLRALVVMTVVFGIAYPVAVWGVGQAAFGNQADGSLVTVDGAVVGSSRIGQTFDGAPWFASRPSAHAYDGRRHHGLGFWSGPLHLPGVRGAAGRAGGSGPRPEHRAGDRAGQGSDPGPGPRFPG